MESVERRIERIFESNPAGVILNPRAFESVGSSRAVQKSLERLTNKGIIQRILRGLYVRPMESKILGTILPPAEEIAQAVAQRDRINIAPTGSVALNLLGLSEQVPLNLEYLTDGAPREFQVGSRLIKFKRVSPKYLTMKGPLSSLAIRALRELGPSRVTQKIEDQIVEILHDETPDNLYHDMQLAPLWIRNILARAR